MRKDRAHANQSKVIGSSPNAVRMQKVVSFYEKLPRGPAPEPEGKGLLGRYQKKYMGKNASARRT
jgi:F-type H+-transporting ATPase subunit f